MDQLMCACLSIPTPTLGMKWLDYIGSTYSKSVDQPGKVASPARGQLKQVNFPLSAFVLYIG